MQPNHAWCLTVDPFRMVMGLLIGLNGTWNNSLKMHISTSPKTKRPTPASCGECGDTIVVVRRVLLDVSKKIRKPFPQHKSGWERDHVSRPDELMFVFTPSGFALTSPNNYFAAVRLHTKLDSFSNVGCGGKSTVDSTVTA